MVGRWVKRGEGGGWGVGRGEGKRGREGTVCRFSRAYNYNIMYTKDNLVHKQKSKLLEDLLTSQLPIQMAAWVECRECHRAMNMPQLIFRS